MRGLGCKQRHNRLILLGFYLLKEEIFLRRSKNALCRMPPLKITLCLPERMVFLVLSLILLPQRIDLFYDSLLARDDGVRQCGHDYFRSF